jgi:hypothetical protein
MKNYPLLALVLFAVNVLITSCQKEDSTVLETITFDTLPVPSTGYWSGADGSGTFSSGKINFQNFYNSSWQTWSGFAYSRLNDTATQGFANQFSVYNKTNADNKFVLFYPPFDGKAFVSFAENEVHIIHSLDICNTTYAALSMKNGDTYCKKFGGTTGNDPDWFKVTIYGYDQNGTSAGSVTCYLADFRSADSSKDYILDRWFTVDLSSLGKINHLSFEFSSSDTGTYGINTPTYLCLDNIRYEE